MRFIPRYNSKKIIQLLENGEVIGTCGYFEAEKGDDIFIDASIESKPLALYGLSLIKAQAVLDCRNYLQRVSCLELFQHGHSSMLTPSTDLITKTQFLEELGDATDIRRYLRLPGFTEELAAEKIDQGLIKKAVRRNNASYLVNVNVCYALQSAGWIYEKQDTARLRSLQ